MGAEALQRASSVPARAPPAPPPPRAPAASPGSADARGGSREPLLASLDDDAHKVTLVTIIITLISARRDQPFDINKGRVGRR